MAIAIDNPKSVFLIGAVLNELRHRSILLPALQILERAVATVKTKADRTVFDQVCSQLTRENREELDAWLMIQPRYSQSLLSWVRQPIGRPCPANVIVTLERLNTIRDLQLAENLANNLSSYRLEMLAREGNKVAVQNLRMFSDTRRYTVMSVSILNIQRALIDEAITMHDRIVGGLFRRCKRRYTSQLDKDSKQIKRTISTFAALGQALIKETRFIDSYFI